MVCPLCQKNQWEIDFKNIEFLRKFLTEWGKIKSREKTHLCNQHQKEITRAIKRARYLALLPY